LSSISIAVLFTLSPVPITARVFGVGIDDVFTYEEDKDGPLADDVTL